MTHRIRVSLEVAPKRTFAVALDWPGWARSGRDEDEALQRLVDYAPRYAAAIAVREPGFRPPKDQRELEAVEILEGGPTTEFGAPGAIPAADHRPLQHPELERQQQLLEAAWAAFDTAAREAAGVELRKGPRGGGRDLAKMIDHVIEAERSYLVRLGARHRLSQDTDPMVRWLGLRATVIATVAARAEDQPIDQSSAAKTRWPPRYFVRRAAWHALDHAWEIADRASPGP
jgi:hypothetical protein